MADDVKDIAIYTGSEWTSLSELAAGVVDVNLPIESVDGTVVLDGAASVFTVSTGGTEKLLIDSFGRFKVFNSTGINTFFVRNDGNVGVGTNGQAYERMNVGGSLVQSGGYAAVGSKVSTSISNDGTGAAPSAFGFESQINATGSERFDRVAHFMANKTNGADIIDNHIGFLANVAGGKDSYAFYASGSTPSYFGGNIKTPSISGLTGTDASVTLGGQATLKKGDGSEYVPSAANSIATKKTVDDKIWVGTTAQYNQISPKLPGTLYCLTD
jgi:hypothetical protein